MNSTTPEAAHRTGASPRLSDLPGLRVQQSGNGAVACLLIHGFAEGAHAWDDVVPALAATFRTVAVDLRGHGSSPWHPTGHYSVESHVADVLAVVDGLRLERFVVVGHSLGGELAIRIAHARPASVVGLVVVDFSPQPGTEGASRVMADFRESLRPWGSRTDYADWLRSRRPLLEPQALARLAQAALCESPGGEGYRLKCDPALERPAGRPRGAGDTWARLEGLAMPALIVRGVGSAVLTADVAQKMARTLRRGALLNIRGAGHAVMADSPAAFIAGLRDFLGQFDAG